MPSFSNTRPRPTASVFLKAGTYTNVLAGNLVSTSAGHGNNNLRVLPWYVDRPITLTRIGADISSAGEAGSTITMGVYADNGDNFPGALLLDSAVSGSASTTLGNGKIAGPTAAMQEITISLPLSPGLYWIGGVIQAAPTTPPTIRVVSTTGFNVNQGTTLPTAGFTANVGYASGAVVSSTLPDPFTPAATATGSVIRPFVKIA